jgi:tetratricopeptide (TPR) repeat protein
MYYLNLALEKDSSIYGALGQRAAIHYKMKKYELALLDCSRMIDISPKLVEGYKRRANIYIDLKQYLKAYTDLTRAILLDPDDETLYVKRGFAAYISGYHEYAIKDYRHILEANKYDAESYYMLHLAYLSQMDTTQALALLDTASMYAVRKIGYHKDLIELAAISGQVEYELNGHNRLVENYNRPRYILDRAIFYHATEKYYMALRDLTVLHDSYPKQPEVLYYLGVVKKTLGEEKEGERLISRAYKLGFEK